MKAMHIQASGRSGTRWKIFLLLLTLVSLNYIDRAALSVAMPAIANEFRFTPQQQGFILSAFFWTYLFMQVPSGMLADRFRPRAVIAAATIGWGFFQGIAAISVGWFTLLLTRLGLGISEAPIYPAGGKLNALWLTRNERTRGAALIDGGSALGSGLGAIITTLLMGWFGSWRAAFAVAGLGTILCGIWAYWYIRNTPREHARIDVAEVAYIERALAEEDRAEPPVKAGAPVLNFLRYRSVWGMCMTHTCTNLIFYGLMTWLPSYLFKARGFNLGAMGNATCLIFFMGFIGEICGGWIADRWKRGAGANRVYRSMMVIGAAAVAASMCMVAFAGSPVVVVVLLCVALFFVRWCGSCNWATPAMLATRGRVGTLSGIMNFVGNIAGIFVPIFIGAIVQHTGSYFLALMFFVAVAGLQISCTLIVDYGKKLPV